MNDSKITQRILGQASESVKRRNPHLFLAPQLRASKPKPDRGSQGQDRRMEKGAKGLAWEITIVQHRRRLLDQHDNLAGACKQIVDRITESLGFDSDSDPALRWRYGQVETRGQQGVMVKIDRIDL